MFTGNANNQCFLATEHTHGFELPMFFGFNKLSRTTGARVTINWS